MKISVKDAVLAAARALGVEDCIEVYFEGEESPLGKRDAGILLECFNRIENELALEYLPLIAEEKVNSVTGVIFYSDLAYPATRILQVEAGDGSLAQADAEQQKTPEEQAIDNARAIAYNSCIRALDSLKKDK